MPGILAALEAEIRRMKVLKAVRSNSLGDPISKISKTKKG
jgi:hypothetical protein